MEESRHFNQEIVATDAWLHSQRFRDTARPYSAQVGERSFRMGSAGVMLLVEEGAAAEPCGYDWMDGIKLNHRTTTCY